MTALLVAAGAALGAPLRLLVLRAAARGGRDPAGGTLLVNVVGSGLLGALLGAGGASAGVLALVGTGFCGTLTTFSTYGADVVRLAEGRRAVRAVGYVTATAVLGIGAATGGYVLTG